MLMNFEMLLIELEDLVKFIKENELDKIECRSFFEKNRGFYKYPTKVTGREYLDKLKEVIYNAYYIKSGGNC